MLSSALIMTQMKQQFYNMLHPEVTNNTLRNFFLKAINIHFGIFILENITHGRPVFDTYANPCGKPAECHPLLQIQMTQLYQPLLISIPHHPLKQDSNVTILTNLCR